MQTRVSALLFSNLLSRSPKPSVTLFSLIHYSTNPNRPSRGERRADDRSEELFLRNLNFGEESKVDKVDNADPYPSSPIPGRPLRDERRLDGGQDDLFPDFNNKHKRLGRTRSNRQPMVREEGGGVRTFQQKLKSDLDANGESFDFFGRKAPAASSGELTGEERSGGSIKNGEQERGGDRIGETLFEKLKLGDLANDAKAEEVHKKAEVSSGTASQPSEPESPPEDAEHIFKKMKDTGLIPNAVAMLDGLCKDGLVQEAMKLFGLMREKGMIPEVVIYTAVVEGFCKAAKFDDAKRIFRKMQKNEIVPNAFSYSILIQGLCKGKRLEDAVELFVEMVDAGHSPNGATFTGLVDVYSREKGVNEAESLVRSLREKGYALDEKAVREHLDKRGPYSPMVWEAIFGKKSSHRHF